MLKHMIMFAAVAGLVFAVAPAGAIDLSTLSPVTTPQPQPDGQVNTSPWGSLLDIQTGGSVTIGGAPQFVFSDINLSGNGLMGWYGHGNFELDDGTGSAQLNTVTVMDNATFEVDRNGAAHGYVATGGMGTQGLGGFCYGLEWNQYSTVTIDQQGGTVNLTNPISDADPWGPGLVMAHGATGGGLNIDHKYNLSGGIMNVSGVINIVPVAPTGPVASGGNGYSPIFNFDGGTMRASQSDSTDPGVVASGWNHLMSNLWHAYVQAGGAVIDTQNFTCSINQALEHDPALGGTPDGGLTKLGSGTLTLLQASTYTGDTAVNGGVLEILHAYLDDASSVSINSMMDLNFVGTDVIFGLTLGGVPQGLGLYNSGTDPAYFTGTGSLQVVPEPATMALLAFGGLGLLLRRRRR